MKIVKTAKGVGLQMTREEWVEMGGKNNWLEVEAKKKGDHPDPTEHGWMDYCIKGPGKGKRDPNAWCAKAVDNAKGTTSWREKD